MAQLNYPLLLDFSLILLLLIVLFWLFRVNNALTRLRNNKGELAKLLAQFTVATQHAEESTRTLKTLGQNTVKNVDASTEKAKRLSDDLSYLIERGGKLADQLEVAISRGRQKEATKTRPENKEAEADDFVRNLANVR